MTTSSPSLDTPPTSIPTDTSSASPKPAIISTSTSPSPSSTATTFSTSATASTSFYDEIEIEDMEYNEDLDTFFYPCPCGDKFQITGEDLSNGEEVARCPSCSLLIRVIYNPEDFQNPPEEETEV